MFTRSPALRHQLRRKPVTLPSSLLHSSARAPSLRLPPSINSTLASAESSSSVTLHGWIRSCRKQKNISFAVLNDGSSLEGVQVVLPKGLEAGVTVGCAVRMKGVLADSPGAGQAKELKANEVEILGSSDAETFPIPNTKQGVPLPVLRRNAHLRPRANQAAAMLRLRSEMSFAVSKYFKDEEFVHVQGALMTTSDCEGAGEVFRVESGAPAPAPSTPSASATPPPPPPTPRYLTVSSQLHIEALAHSLNKVYTLSPAFRAETSDTSRHLQEFWMLEAEVGFLEEGTEEGMEQVMGVAEGVIKAVVRSVSASADQAYFVSQSTDGSLAGTLEALGKDAPYARMSYTEAVEALQAHAATNPSAFRFAPEWGASLQTEHELFLATHHVKGPVFITSYPTHLKPFYMLPCDTSTPERPTTACFDLLVPGLGELVGGSLREYRLEMLEDRMKQEGMEGLEWYKDLRRWGTMRHGGFGLGWERLVKVITGAENVRECAAFPVASEGSRF